MVGIERQIGKYQKAKIAELQLPNVELQLPNVELQLPNVERQLPNVELQLPNVELQLPNVELQLLNVELQLPNVERQLPIVERQLPIVERQFGLFSCFLWFHVKKNQIRNCTKRAKSSRKGLFNGKSCSLKNCSTLFPQMNTPSQKRERFCGAPMWGLAFFKKICNDFTTSRR
ncbi:MAG: hypothetical protein LBI18_07800 [Planctomycetaceae bacterium]|nr:hypothetical protein [Planctomycetaceae bacterium]